MNVDITGYELFWDSGVTSPSQTFTKYGTTTTNLEYTVTGLTGGTTYTFKVRGLNKYNDPGAFSSVSSVLTAQAPDAPAAPIVELVTSQVRIRWSDPTVTNNRPITAYRIKIIDKDGNAQLNTTVCDGSRASVIASKACMFPMSYLIDAPYLLSRGDDIQAVVEAYNERGWSSESPESATGVLVKTIPD